MPPPLLLFEDSQVDRLYPLTYTRAACELRAGLLTLLERFITNLRGTSFAGVLVRPHLASVVRRRVGEVPVNPSLSTREGILLVNARWLLRAEQAAAFRLPDVDTAGLAQSTVVWAHLSAELASTLDLSRIHEPRAFDAVLPKLQRIAVNPAPTLINRPWDLLDAQRGAILEDFARLGAANHGQLLPGAHLLAPEKIHIARGVKIWPGAVLDAQNGPILIGEDTEIGANAVITGPVAFGAHCVIRTGADIREDSSFGPNSRVGGEIINSLFLGNANKQHHGFVGQTIVGEWANLGAGTTTSNLKNTYGNVKMPLTGADEASGRLFLGSLIADHAKLGIGTYLSTGSVIGFGSHVVVPRPPRFVPSFAWVTDKGVARADFEKLEQVAATVMKRRGQEFTPEDHELWVRLASEFAPAEQFTWPDA